MVVSENGQHMESVVFLVEWVPKHDEENVTNQNLREAENNVREKQYKRKIVIPKSNAQVRARLFIESFWA